MILAAIWYNIDQNQPSCPFLLDLPVPADATREQVDEALKKFYAYGASDHPIDVANDPDAFVVDPASVTVHSEDYYGDLRIMSSEDEDGRLFVSFSEADRRRLGIKA